MKVMNDRMTDKEWWERYSRYPIERGFLLTYEDLFQMFKKRMMEELPNKVEDNKMLVKCPHCKSLTHNKYSFCVICGEERDSDEELPNKEDNEI